MRDEIPKCTAYDSLDQHSFTILPPCFKLNRSHRRIHYRRPLEERLYEGSEFFFAASVLCSQENQ